MKKLALAGVIAAMALTFSGCDLITAGKEKMGPESIEMSKDQQEEGPGKD